MANTTSKQMPTIDDDNAIKQAFNIEDKSLTINSFLVGKVGHKITRTVISPTVDDYSFFDGAVLLYTYRITYSNAGHDDINQAERTV